MDHQRSSQFGYSRQSTPPSTSLTPRHICSLCGKSRSKRYHDQHPLLLGQAPEHGICSRPKCAKAVNEMLRPPCPVIIYEIHHHYHSSSGLEGPPPSYTAAELRLTDNTLRRDLSPIREESPPSMNITSGPGETPPNYTAAELSGESSLTGRVELPDNRCSRRHAFRRVSPMAEELPPPVNFLKKPTLQKKK
ncbi:hypothetical protein DL98DRAFT_542151 [Cadophora sp. DSE1049]|nr:hypothetical protein DL98DRAFT_542151 [Cadophora sp. DSE1049]